MLCIDFVHLAWPPYNARKGPHKSIVQTHRAGIWVTPDEQQHYHFRDELCPFRAPIDVTIKPELQVYNLEVKLLAHNCFLGKILVARTAACVSVVVTANNRGL